MTRGPATPQLALALGPYDNRQLFSEHFLAAVLVEWPEWTTLDPAALYAGLQTLWQAERSGLINANEAQTEERLVKPVLALLGFAFTVQTSVPTAGGRRQPDYALFVDDADRRDAGTHTGVERYRSAVAVCDAKRFGRALDGRERSSTLSDDPVAQIIHYVAITRTRWGLLTNGRLWRLYAAEGDMVEGACVEFDLGALLEAGDVDAFRYFALMLGAEGFRADAAGDCLLDRMLRGSSARAVAVGDQLRRQVFAAVPLVAEGLLEADERTPEALRAGFDNALVVLYRLLFCLHAEDRRLLPVDNVHYASYSLTRQREGLARDIGSGRRFSSRSDDLFNDLRALFRIVDRGDPALGVNEYDGGLFAAAQHPWLRDRSVPDDLLATALDLLYRVHGEQVDYRDLSVRHLGTIFEQLLAHRLGEGADGHLTLEAAGGRKATGAYFTPELVVDELVERTLAPVFEARAASVASAGLRGDAVLEALLDIHVLDPAMGSGHFLVGAAAYLARRIATEPAYTGELGLPELQGLVAERCLYGVDLNPMAVEVARLALWLATVRDDRPLRLLANLRTGNALVGAELRVLLDGGADLFTDDLAVRAKGMLDAVASIAATDVQTGEEAHEQQVLLTRLDAMCAPLLDACDAAVAPPVGPESGRSFHWEIEFPGRFLTSDGRLRPDAGFDAVIGNPPYLRIQELGRDVAAHCRERYATAFGSFDAYVPFLERGIGLLRSGGRLGFIVPSTWLKLDYGRRLRALLARERLVDEVVDFGHVQVFDSATNYTCLLVLQRGGVDALRYVRLGGTAAQVRRTMATGPLPRGELYPAGDLSSDPWLLLPSEERAVIGRMLAETPRLHEVTAQIFQGLITSLDPFYIVEELDRRGGRVEVRTKAGDVLELEADLLHPLASGGDVERYALRPLRSLLLFPYVRDSGGAMRLMTETEMAALPLSWAYFAAHEVVLRGRERGKMDRDGWWGYVYPKSLAAHDLPKLGIAATVRHLEVAADFAGAAFFHNVRVNGVLPLPGGPTLAALVALLNCQVVDFAFRRGAAPLQNGFFTANKQFVSWLPVPAVVPARFDALGHELHDRSSGIEAERHGFFEWLASVLGVDPRTLPGSRHLGRYEQHGAEATLAMLDAAGRRVPVDVTARALRSRIRDEVAQSTERLLTLAEERRQLEVEADELAVKAYGLSAAQARLVAQDHSSSSART